MRRRMHRREDRELIRLLARLVELLSPQVERLAEEETPSESWRSFNLSNVPGAGQKLEKPGPPPRPCGL